MQICSKNTIIKIGAIVSLIAIFNVGVVVAFAFEKHEIAPEIMLELTNRSREANGVPELNMNTQLVSAAEAKANDMFKSQYFNHESPNGKTPWEFIRSAGYEYLFAGENLAMDFVSAEGVHKALMDSSSHRENLLNANYSDVGIAVKRGIFDGAETVIVVEEFGSPLARKNAVEFQKAEVQVETDGPTSTETDKVQAPTAVRVVPEQDSAAINDPENDDSCNSAGVELEEENTPEAAGNIPIRISDTQYTFFKDFYICSSDIDDEIENIPDVYVADIKGERSGMMSAEGPLKYLAVIDSFEKEIMLILLSFAVSMNLYYISDEDLRNDDG
ncbi:MAG: CAP domain-containing protein [Candidatus Paceibacterota bacterium]